MGKKTQSKTPPRELYVISVEDKATRLTHHMRFDLPAEEMAFWMPYLEAWKELLAITTRMDGNQVRSAHEWDQPGKEHVFKRI